MISSIFSISNQRDFNELAIQIFYEQLSRLQVYKEFVQGINFPAQKSQESIFPYLPIEFFKTHKIITSPNREEAIFTSSGTEGMGPSKHFVSDLNLYEHSFIKGFERQYGTVEEFTVLALLPAYLEREGSSLVYMAEKLIRMSESKLSGFYLDDFNKLAQVLGDLDRKGKRILLLGVSFALLDLIELGPFRLRNTIVMETGGMKGRRKEITRPELHELLKKGFGVSTIHSEYGMTELLSQAYSTGEGRFRCPPWMKVSIREINDPFEEAPTGKTGGINVIDLANLNSCSFIATQDLGRFHSDGSFEVLGRFDHSDTRGCNLMVV